MHPYIIPHLPGGCIKDRSKRSLVLDRATTRTLSRNQAVAGNRRTWSWSGWVKRGTLGILSGIFGASVGNATYYFWAYFGADDRLNFGQFGAGILAHLGTTAVYRDPTAWMHILIVVDTTQATASERLRLYVNGERITGFSAATYPALNTELVFNSNIPHRIGAGIDVDGGLYQPITCNMAEVHFTDGIVLQPADVGATDPRSSNWMHRHFDGDHGAQGYYLPFTGDAGDAPATAAEGCKDRALITGAHAAANDWTPVNIAAADFVRDVPTNWRNGDDFRGNMLTLDPAMPASLSSQGLALIRGGLSAVNSGRAFRSAWPISLIDADMVYFEFVMDQISGGYPRVGFAAQSYAGSQWWSPGDVVGPGGFELRADGAAIHNGASAGAHGALTAGHVNRGCFQRSTGKIWFGNAAGWFNAGDPDAGTGQMATLSAAEEWWIAGGVAAGAGVSFNFGQKAFTHTPPSKSVPACVAASQRPSIVKPSTAFVQDVDSGANISAALASKRVAWGASYIDIIKRYDAAEGWRLRFGDDPGNYLDSSSIANGKQAFPALAGTKVWGCSIRVGADYGVATGEIAHVNGAPTTITDNLGTARKIVIIRRVGAGGTFPTYHPDLPAGKLMYLNTNAAAVVAGDITNVLANSVQIGAGMPTDDYRYIILAETPGLITIDSYTGFGAVDGARVPADHSPGLRVVKEDNVNGWYLLNRAVDPANPATTHVRMNEDFVESTVNMAMDFLANGTKARTTDSNINRSGGLYYGFTIADAAFFTGDCAAQATAR